MAFSRRTRALLALLVIAVAPRLHSQGSITLAAGQTLSVVALPNAKLAVPIVIDMSAASGGTNLAALTTAVAWGSSRLVFDSIKAGAFGALTSNMTNAANGGATLSLVNATGTTSTVTFATLYFTAAATNGSTRLLLGPSLAADESTASVMALLRLRNLDVCVGPTGFWGDSNDDGTVNIIDAQQIARASVSLPIISPPAMVARGDVTADGAVNIIDA